MKIDCGHVATALWIQFFISLSILAHEGPGHKNRLAKLSQMWSDFDEIRYQVRFELVENRVRISGL